MLNKIKDFKLKKGQNVGLKNIYACGLAKVVIEENKFKIIKDDDSVCTIKEDKATDFLLNDRTYDVYEGALEAKKAYKEGKLEENTTFCYSVYDFYSSFPEAKGILNNKEEVKDFLRKYNEQNHTFLYWNFLDKDEKEKLDEIVNENRVKLQK